MKGKTQKCSSVYSYHFWSMELWDYYGHFMEKDAPNLEKLGNLRATFLLQSIHCFQIPKS